MSGTIAGATESYVAVEGVRFHVWRGGPARRRKTTPALLLHGVPQTAYVWRELLPELAKDRVVIAPDLKGLGESEGRAPYDMATLTAELAALVLHEVDGPVDVVGHDWGGSVALGLATARPDLVRRLVDISAPYRKVDLVHAWHMPAFLVPGLPEVAFRVGGDRLVRGMLRHAWGSGPPLPEDVVEHYVAAYADPTRVSAMSAYYRDIAGPRAARAVTRLVRRRRPQPAVLAPAGPRYLPLDRSLVIWGTQDPAMPMRIGEAVVKDLGPTSSMLSLPGVGHWAVEEAPDVVVPAIAEFLRS